MMTLTHLTAGAMATAGILQTTNPTLLIVGACASLLPDIDLSVSPAGRVFFFISWWLEKHFPHRGPTHSIFVAGLTAFCVYAASLYFGWNPQIAIAVFLGYAVGGIFPDCLTKSGAAIFWPLDNYPWWVPNNHRYRLSTGSRAEYVLLTVLLCCTALIFNINNKGGFEIGFGQMLGSVSGVEQVYNKYGSTNQIVVTVDGVRAIDRLPIKRDFTLLQAQGQGFLLLDKGGEIFKAGTEPDVQIVSSKINAKPGKRVATIIQPVAINDGAIAPVLVNLYQSHPESDIYLSGQISIEDSEELLPQTVPGQFPVIQKFQSVIVLEGCPIKLAYQQLSAQWGTGTLNARIIRKQ